MMPDTRHADNYGCTRLSGIPMEEDVAWFNKTRTPANYAMAVAKITANLVEGTSEPSKRDHAPLVLTFERPDSMLRLMAFSLGTTFYFAVDTDNEKLLHTALGECWRHTVQFATSVEGRRAVFTGQLDIESALLSARSDVTRTVEGWKDYARYFMMLSAAARPVNCDDHSARIVSAMFRHIESSDPMTDADAQRLLPLSRWMESTTRSIKPAFHDLTK